MKILCVIQAENLNFYDEIAKQTVKPNDIIVYKDEDPAKTIETRRKRIAENHHKLVESVEEVQSDYDFIWQIEGDAEIPEDALERLIEDYKFLSQDNDVAYVSGIQVGRHGVYCLGAWHVSDDELKSADHRLEGLQEVDATGFYCLLAPIDKWLSGKASWDGQIYGPDVVWGLSLGGKKFIDMRIKLGHKIKSGVIRPDDLSTCNVSYKKIDGKWHFKQLD